MDTKKLIGEYNKYNVMDAYRWLNLDFPTKTLTLTEYAKPISDEAFTNITKKIKDIGRAFGGGEQTTYALFRYMMNSLYGLSPRALDTLYLYGLPSRVINAYGSMVRRARKSRTCLSLWMRQKYIRELSKRQPFSKVCNLESVIHSFIMEPDFSEPEGTIHIYVFNFKIHKEFYPDINVYDCKCNSYYDRYYGLHIAFEMFKDYERYERLYNPETNNKRCLESVIKKGRIKGGSSKRG